MFALKCIVFVWFVGGLLSSYRILLNETPRKGVVVSWIHKKFRAYQELIWILLWPVITVDDIVHKIVKK